MPVRQASGMTPEEFKAIRMQLGLTQTEFAGLLGMKLREIQRLEAGERKVSITVARLAKLLTIEKNRNFLLTTN